MIRSLSAILILLILPAAVWAQCPTTTEAGKPVVWVNEEDLVAKDGGSVVYLGCDTVWGFKERIYVVDPNNTTVPTEQKITELYVGTGTIIKGGNPGDVPDGVDYATGQPVGVLEEVSALLIAQGGYAEMIGSANAPIVMTWWEDDVDDPFDLVHPARTKWGGMLILGRTVLDCQDPVTGEPCDTMIRYIEGIPEADPDYALSTYGCDIMNPDMPCDDYDNSGIYRYISIRHGGYEIGEANEINGLTMGAVGAGTTIEYIEIFENLDDGFEWFGGTVNCRYLVSAMNGDDAFDYDQGYRGYGQFWFSLQAVDLGNHAGEHDGQESPEWCRPYARPDIANATYMGSGRDNADQTSNTHTFNIRDNAGGHYRNSVFFDFPQKYLKLENAVGTPDPTGPCVPCDVDSQDTEMRARCADLTFESTFWYDFGTPGCQAAWECIWLFDIWPNNTDAVDPLFYSYPPTRGPANVQSRELGNLMLIPVPRPDSPLLEANGAILSDLTASPDTADDCGVGQWGCIDDLPAPAWYQKVPYAGAFAPNEPMWTDGWTFLSQAGYTTPRFNTGDPNESGLTDIDDVVYLISYIFTPGSPAPKPYATASGDPNCSCLVDIDDVVYLISYIFTPGSPAPCSYMQWVGDCGSPL